MQDKLIIITSDEPWGDVWHTQLHYAYQLSKRCTVYYIAPPGKWKLSNLFLWKLTVKQEKENLFVMNYLNVFPVSIMNGFFTKLNDLVNSFLLKRKIPKEKTKIIFWRFTYYRLLENNFITPFRTVYHVVDHYMGKKNDAVLAKKSNLVIFTSPKFIDHYKRYNPHVINVPQAVSREETESDASAVSRIRDQYHNIILFTGTISHEISLDIFEKVSETFPHHTLLLIGPEKLTEPADRKQFEHLCNKPNVKYAGIKPGSEIKNYVKAAGVCIIPYKFSHEKKMSIRSPLKAINYLAQKKIIITTTDCEIKELENKIIYTASNTDEFMDLMQKAISKKLIMDEKATDAFLKRISYDTLIDFIFSKVRLYM